MFTQIIEGRVNDEAALRRRLDIWEKDVKPGATGHLGSTGGVTKDGESIAIVRFESEDAARKNSERPEQGKWWSETEKVFDGPVTFRESSDVEVVFEPSAQVGFVQVMQGRTKDVDKFRRFNNEHIDDLRRMRPDVVGDVIVFHGKGEYTEAIYFTSEEAAREGEKKMSDGTPEEKEMFADFMANMDGEPKFFDLPNPDLR